MGVVWGEDGSACQQSHTQDIHGNVCVEFWRHWRTHAIILTDADLNEQVFPEYCTSLYACNTISHSHTDAHSSKIHVISRMFSSTPRRQWDWGRLHRPLRGRLSVGNSSSPALLFHLLLISNLNEKGKWCCNSKKEKKDFQFETSLYRKILCYRSVSFWIIEDEQHKKTGESIASQRFPQLRIFLLDAHVGLLLSSNTGREMSGIKLQSMFSRAESMTPVWKLHFLEWPFEAGTKSESLPIYCTHMYKWPIKKHVYNLLRKTCLWCWWWNYMTKYGHK